MKLSFHPSTKLPPAATSLSSSDTSSLVSIESSSKEEIPPSTNSSSSTNTTTTNSSSNEHTTITLSSDNDTHSLPTYPPPSSYHTQQTSLKLSLISSLGSILSGYHLAVIAVALPSLTHDLSLTPTQIETMAAIFYLGGSAGCTLGGTLCDLLGRKTSILVVDAIFVLGSLVTCMARGYWGVGLGRFIVGFGVSYGGVACVSYLTEMNPRETRGGRVSFHEFFTCVGVWVSAVVGYVVVDVGESLEEEGGDVGYWRDMFGYPTFLAVAQFGFMWHLPESHVWESMKRRRERDRQMMLEEERLRQREAEEEQARDIPIDDYDQSNVIVEEENDNNNDDSDDEDIQQFASTIASLPTSTPPGSRRSSIARMKDAYIQSIMMGQPPNKQYRRASNTVSSDLPAFYRRAATIVAMLAISQQFCGHVNVLSFAPDIYSRVIAPTTTAKAEMVRLPSSHDDATILIPSVFLSTVKLLVTGWVTWEVDAGWGRRKLLLFGILLITASLFLLIVASFTIDAAAAVDSQLHVAQVLTVVGTCGVVVGYASSFGPLTWLITSELFPSHIRGRALGASSTITSFSAYVISYTFFSFQSIHPSAPYILYFISSLSSLSFAILAIPDTGDTHTTHTSAATDVDADIHVLERRLASMPWWRVETHESTPQERASEFVKAMDLEKVDDEERVCGRQAMMARGLSTKSMSMRGFT